jgi:hypothetical protein
MPSDHAIEEIQLQQQQHTERNRTQTINADRGKEEANYKIDPYLAYTYTSSFVRARPRLSPCPSPATRTPNKHKHKMVGRRIPWGLFGLTAVQYSLSYIYQLD